MKLCPKCQKQFSDDANFCPVDAARLVPLENQAAGDSLAIRFELKERLGGSRTGAVHAAVERATGKRCVVKLVAPAVVALPGVAQRLERELKQLERVQSAGVARVLGSGKRRDETWIAMELLDNAHTLAEAITSRGPIPIEQAADLIEVVGEALIEAAQVGVVHRDLAPKNVLFAGQDVKLINFSLPVPTTDKVPGVAEFVAPEQVDGRAVDQRSNLYGLGALYYFVLTGQPVHAAATPAEVHQLHVGGAIRPPSQLVAVPAPIEAVIMRALDRSPTKRFLTVRQFVDEVTRVGRGEVIELKQTMAMGRVGKPKGELVQTLMGVRGKGGEIIVPARSPIASAPTVGAGLPAAAAAPAPTPVQPAARAPAPNQPLAPSTVLGLPGPGLGGPAGVKPLIAPQEVAGSPWSGPGHAAAQMAARVDPAPPIVAPPVVAPPVVAAPILAAPVVAKPQVAAPVVAKPQVAAPAGKKKADEPGAKGKFRETMWFKKGELDAQAAQAAADEHARTGKDAATDKADSLPMDERYKDDGSISRSDKEKYSLRTGATQMMSRIDGPDASMNKVSEDALIGEMKGGRRIVMIAIALAVAAIVAILYMVAR